MSITNATTQESLVQYPSPYKVVDGNLCMEVTEKHSTYDRKLSNFTPYIKSELTIDSLPSTGCLKSGERKTKQKNTLKVTSNLQGITAT